LDDLLKYFDIAYNTIKVRFFKAKNFNIEQLKNYENHLLGNIDIPKESEINYENSQEITHNSINNPIFENNVDNDLKHMDIFSLENQIIDMCDDSSLFYNNQYDYPIDNFIENVFVDNNIIVNDNNCSLCEVPKENNKTHILNSLFKQLGEIEQAVQLTKQELVKMENKNIEHISSIDNIFNF
jgi:hypothetical protein